MENRLLDTLRYGFLDYSNEFIQLSNSRTF
jgi:hypothetical protein